MSDMEMRNSRGASTAPWGKELLTLIRLNTSWFTRTCWDRLIKKKILSIFLLAQLFPFYAFSALWHVWVGQHSSQPALRGRQRFSQATLKARPRDEPTTPTLHHTLRYPASGATQPYYVPANKGVSQPVLWAKGDDATSPPEIKCLRSGGKTHHEGRVKPSPPPGPPPPAEAPLQYLHHNDLHG